MLDGRFGGGFPGDGGRVEAVRSGDMHDMAEGAGDRDGFEFEGEVQFRNVYGGG